MKLDIVKILRNINNMRAFMLGMIAILLQTMLFRELTLFLGSNEFVVSLMLTLWLLSSGAGAFLLYSKPKKSVAVIFLILASLANILVLLIGLLAFKSVGSPLTVWKIVMLSILSISPVAIFSGAYFSELSNSSEKSNLIYAFEGLGALFGGILSILTITLFPTGYLIIVCSLIFALILLGKGKFNIALGILIAVIFSMSFVFSTPIMSKYFNNSQIISASNTKSGKLEICEINSEKFAYFGSNFIGTETDTLSAGLWLHTAMLTSNNNETVLLKGGVLGGAVRELGKYNCKKALYIEEDRKYLDDLITYFPNQFHENVKCKDGSVNAFFKTKCNKIIYAPSMPSSITENRFYTIEHFKNIEKALRDNGVFILFLNTGENYLTDNQRELTGTIWRTLLEVFEFSEGYFLDGKVMLIAYKSKPSASMIDKFKTPELLQIPDGFYKVEHLAQPFNLFRQKDFLDSIGNLSDYKINSKLYPAGFIYGIHEILHLANINFPKSRVPAFIFIGLLVALSIFSFIRESKSSALYSYRLALLGGVFGIGSSILLLFIAQSVAGGMYKFFGLLVGLFMMGTVIPVYLQEKLKKLMTMQIIGSMLMFLGITTVIFSGDIFPIFFLPFLCIIAGLLNGALYSKLLQSKEYYNKPGLLYSLDLLGSAIFSIIPVMFILPVMGFTGYVVVIGSLLFLGFFSLRKSE